MGRPSNTEQRRAEIAAALGALIASEGYERATIAAIAKRAGLAPGLVHYHFRDKDEILLALVARIVATLEARVEARLRECTGDARARLHVLVDAHVALGDDDDPVAVATWAAIAAEAMRREEVQAHYARAIAATLGRLEKLVRAALREAGKETRAAKAIAAAVLSAIEGAYLLHRAAPGVLPPGYAAPALHALIDGVLDA
ncbi:MAG: TetR family transcriptional regulator [Deltaproteobacteria bacterium]|nr:TetR family transcriptional regulator [Deltaproteobacteria bacterium]